MLAVTDYQAFLATKTQYGADAGFTPLWLPDFLFGFQRALVEWAIRKGRAAIFADCGLGKTPMLLVWAENVIRHTNGRILILTPLAVGEQTIREAEKFGIEAHRSRDGRCRPNITVANYEIIHHFNPGDFAGVVCDESSILKSFDGVRRGLITEFLRTQAFRLLCTATAAPNDYVELGTSSEALGYLGHVDMLTRFFRNDGGAPYRVENRSRGAQWGFKRHAEQAFWRWVCSWARTCRKPSDLGYDDGAFRLPPLREQETTVVARRPREGFLFDLPAIGFREERELHRRTIQERCAAVAEKVADTSEPAVAWCHLNREADLLTEMIQHAEQVSGDDPDEAKEEKFLAFQRGALRVLITKPKIAGWGLNWEHCAHLTYFPSHSYEAYYQAVRRCWRFGQTRPVVVDLVMTNGDGGIMANLRRKTEAADKMFSDLASHMNGASGIQRMDPFVRRVELPAWLSPNPR